MYQSIIKARNILHTRGGTYLNTCTFYISLCMYEDCSLYDDLYTVSCDITCDTCADMQSTIVLTGNRLSEVARTKCPPKIKYVRVS